MSLMKSLVGKKVTVVQLVGREESYVRGILLEINRHMICVRVTKTEDFAEEDLNSSDVRWLNTRASNFVQLEPRAD